MPPLVSPMNRTLSPGMTGWTTVRLSLSFTGDLKYHISHDHSLSANFTNRKGNNSEAFTIVNIAISLISRLMTKLSFCFTFIGPFISFHFTHHRNLAIHYGIFIVVLSLNLEYNCHYEGVLVE